MKDFDIMRFLDSILCPDLEYRSLEKDLTEEKNINTELCQRCEGKCCKRCGCHFSPDDFKEISFEYLKSQIQKGNISIDYASRDVLLSSVGVYFLRIRNANSPVVDTDYRRRNPCKLLTEHGCMLSYDERPTGGKLLIPRSVYDESYEKELLICSSKYSIENCCYEWKPHQKILHQLVKYFRDKNF